MVAEASARFRERHNCSPCGSCGEDTNLGEAFLGEEEEEASRAQTCDGITLHLEP